MSGGYFDYEQYKLSRIAADIEQLILNEESEEVDSWGSPKKKGWSKDTLDAFEEAVIFLRVAEIYTQRIDWLVSGDDSEESFKKRLGKELQEAEQVFLEDVKFKMK